MNLTLTAILLFFVFATTALGSVPYVVVLGVAQDAGVPQMGCNSPFCQKAWTEPSLRQMVSSIALVDPETGGRWIFDATPDLPEQFEFLKQLTGDRTNRIDGIFLTHAHIGHYTGLMYLGRESMNSSDVKVYAMPKMRQMLEQNAPWSQLVSLKNIDLEPIAADSQVPLNQRLNVEAFRVPHRDEFSETVGFRIKSPLKTLIYIPDIDKWEKWSTSLESIIGASDYLLIDGTFYADGELARPMSEVPHPFVSETMTRLRSLSTKDRGKIYFTHFNHSNPLVQGNKKTLSELNRKGFHVASKGLKLYL